MAKKKFNFNKLIRDKIPQAIRDSGCTVHDYELVGSELDAALKNKIIEEAREVAESKSVDEVKGELADLLEVAYAIMSSNNIDPVEVEKIRLAKNQERGNFSRGVYVSFIEVDEENPRIKYYMAREAKYPEKMKD